MQSEYKKAIDTLRSVIVSELIDTNMMLSSVHLMDRSYWEHRKLLHNEMIVMIDNSIRLAEYKIMQNKFDAIVSNNEN